MQIDELKSELRALADEIAPFEGDALSAHRRHRRRRTAITSVAAALAFVVAVAAIAAVWHKGGDHVTVYNAKKEYRVAQLRSVDLIVVPGDSSVQKTLEESALVAEYAPLPAGPRSMGSGEGHDILSGQQGAVLCSLEHDSGFAVQSAQPFVDITNALQQELGPTAKVYDMSHAGGGDVEVFMRPTASQRQVDDVQHAVATDADIESYKFYDHNAAYERFQHEFADQPALVQGTSAAELPESFLLVTRTAGDRQDQLAERYRRLFGVNDVITRGGARLSPLLSTPWQPPLGPAEADVFMTVGATPAQVDAVRKRLANDPFAANVTFLDHDAALREFQKEFKKYPLLLAMTTADALPESFRLRITKPDEARSWRSRYASMPGVTDVILENGLGASPVSCDQASTSSSAP